MENKQTAVEWLAEVTAKIGYISTDILEKAKQMEKEQILDSFDSARKFRMKNVFQYDLAKDYYNETYGK